MLETRSRKARHTQEETTRWTSVRLAKARAKAKGSKDSKDNNHRTRARIRTRTRIRLNVGTRKTVGARSTPTKVVRKGKHEAKNATDARNLDSTKPANVEPEVEIGGSDMSYLDADAVEVRESEWIKIGVDTGAGKTAWPQSVTYGRKLPGHVDLTYFPHSDQRACQVW